MSDQKFDLTKFDKVIADVDLVKDEGNFLPDMSSKEGYEASKRFVLDKTTPMRKALEAAHKEVKAPFWDTCKFLDAKKKELMSMIEEIESPHKLAYKERDAEIKRKKEEAELAVQNKINWFDQVIDQAFNATSEQIEKLLEDCQDFDMDFDFFGKRIEEAQNKQVDTIQKLTERLTQQIQFEQAEKQRLEFEEKQRELEEREAKIREQEEAKQAAIQSEIEAKERAEREEKQRIEREEAEKRHQQEMKLLAERQEAERLEREKQLKLQAEREEKERLALIEQERIAAEKAEKERIERENEMRKTRTKNRNEAAKQLMELAGIEKEQAIKVCNSIAENKVTFLTANF